MLRKFTNTPIYNLSGNIGDDFYHQFLQYREYNNKILNFFTFLE